MKSEVSTQPIAKNRMVKCTLFFFFAMATAMLVFSHHAVTSSALAGDRSEKLSVPVPKRQPAKGGLPPIPDFVMKQLEEKSDTGNNAVAAGKPDISDFPLPSDAVPVGSAPSEIMLKPTFGSHRPDRNAVFAFAEGYDLQVYTTFIESLKQTSFTGDVVLAVSYVGGMKPGVEEYLRSYSQQDSLRVISYALEWECYKKSGVRILPENGEGRGSTTNHGFSDCKIHGLYSDGEGGETLEPAQDPREARPVATARYELYWIFSRQYRKDSSMLIIDVRDTYFQSNPFEFQSIPHLEGAYLPMNQGKGCRLELFEENFEAVDIGKSSYNSKWVRTAYGQKALNKISSKPVICSGSTMGTQYAVELYSAAMVAQFDETKCKQVGCDQGFHNYLYYEGGLISHLKSHHCAINVYKQGDGAVNNLAAMRESPLRSQGVLSGAGDGAVVLNNNDSVPSPVVHQFDRDKELKGILKGRTSKIVSRWKASQS